MWNLMPTHVTYPEALLPPPATSAAVEWGTFHRCRSHTSPICHHLLLRYRYTVRGANAATSTPDERSTQPICPAVAVPCISPRTPVARGVTGLARRTAPNQAAWS